MTTPHYTHALVDLGDGDYDVIAVIGADSGGIVGTQLPDTPDAAYPVAIPWPRVASLHPTLSAALDAAVDRAKLTGHIPAREA